MERSWKCHCGRTVTAWGGDTECDCGAEYNAFGQLLRPGWRDNRSNWDEDVSDLDGYEDSLAGDQ